MARLRAILICLDDVSLAHSVALQLQGDAVRCVVCEHPSRFAEHVRGSFDGLIVQDRYPSGEAGPSLLRQTRIAKGSPVPTVYVATAEVGGADRHVLEQQYRVGAVVAAADAERHLVREATRCFQLVPGRTAEDDVVLHEDELKLAFHISVEGELPVAEQGVVLPSGFQEDTLRPAQAPVPRNAGSLPSPGPAERRGAPLTGSVVPPAAAPKEDDGLALALDGLTLEGASMEEDGAAWTGEASMEEATRIVATSAYENFPPRGSSPGTAKTAPAPEEPASVSAPAADGRSPRSSASPESSEIMQVTDLKKALLIQKKAREAAEARVKELEARVAQLAPPGGASDEGGMPAEGVFEDLRYPQLLARARHEGFTGAIKLQLGSANTRTVFLRDGLPVGYASSEPGERIGRMMVEQKRITDEQYIKAATMMVEQGIKLAEALVELGFIEGETLAVEMRNLTRDQIIQGFEVTQGRFTCTQGQLPGPSVSLFDFGPGEIYVQGFRRYAPAAEMQALFETMRTKYLTPNERLALYRPKLGLSSDDERLLRLLGEAYTLEEAVERAGLSPESAARLTAALWALDLVEEWSPGVEQFSHRLRAERQQHAEEIAALRAEMGAREKQLFEGFERALEKIGAAVGGPAVSMGTPSLPAGPASKSPPSATAKAAISLPHEPTTQTVVSAASTPPGSHSPQAESSTESPFGREPLGNSPSEQKYRAGLEQANLRNLDEAEVLLREAVRLDATRPDYLLTLARVLLANPRYERSGTLPVVRSLLDRAAQLAPENGEVRSLRNEVMGETA
ncbi:MAG: DUF4388 domain-containing protein [Myxococcota bacterium]